MEIEVRILDVDIHEIRRKIFEYNGVLVKKENQINKLFDFDDDRLLRNNGYARIRIIKDLISDKNFYYMTSKRKLSKSSDKYKVMDEQEVLIDSWEIGENIFKSLGLSMKNEIKKYRESYKINDVLIEIDINDKSFYPNPYVEIEGESINEIEEVVNILGYSMEDTTSKSIFELIEDLNKNKIDYE
ncbi:adenylate cyclase [Candidatus Arthromitus sp. SFB-mouse-Japan]|uniref:class IV adenylate cyclase n=1 Tax=unclassified Candidatus Neoarthromitus TaxID=2638829 RepID=UPI00021B7DFC|nr:MULTISPECIES: CYTH domain-containing protein [unclassified Candidatus Arthromitus]EIA24780.1 adenylate cyclase [Candidatus Arthromitus sp. SFB-3]EIA29179.1 adenylate cyclase [Candidatus Arthromitus sp. SFB-co]EIA29517.1 adenylate cyclase [Candidatus Arthromitus sp. SFB-4]EIA30404.1 adenylate cyclase [Candidatus Arthromitus sp. SFB-mouse-SU]AID44299.1 Adenylate cyclase [Candidatus Arthromitus sp. SFB-mouse-NL]